MSTFTEVKQILGDALSLDLDTVEIEAETALVGNIPEFDSMAVVTIITAIEENYGIFIDDDEIDAEIFETMGSLVKFVEQKLEQ